MIHFHATTYKHQSSPFETSILRREPTAVVTEIQAGYNHSSSSFRPQPKIKKPAHNLTNDVNSFKRDPMKIQNVMGKDKWTFVKTPKKIETHMPKKLLSLAQLQNKQLQEHVAVTKEIEDDIFLVCSKLRST
jgi:HD-GYP domain-containing protein (c-di-GMP phosphodiesterase class II)